jgi:hypothetical protein
MAKALRTDARKEGSMQRIILPKNYNESLIEHPKRIRYIDGMAVISRWRTAETAKEPLRR